MGKLGEVIWENYHGVLRPEVAPHVLVSVSRKEARQLIRRKKAYLLSYVSDWDCEEETNYWYVIKDSFGDFAELSRNMRNQVRKALKNCDVKKVGVREIIEKGYDVYRSAYRNYNTVFLPSDRAEFTRELERIDREFFAVYDKSGVMIAYGQNSLIDGSCEYCVVKSHPDYLKLYPNYALFYEMNKNYLATGSVKYVNDGARSLSHDTNIQNFLISKFKFRKAYCRLNIVYRLDVAMFVRVIFPFRNIINRFKSRVFVKLSVLLKLEDIRRRCRV